MGNIEQTTAERAERARAAIADSVRGALVQAGYDMPEPEPAFVHTIPMRYWPNPDTAVLGYLDVHEERSGDGTLTYEMTFRASPLAEGERPLYELRFDFEDGAQ